MIKYIILGLGKSGKATAAWCKRQGFSACIVDDAKESAQGFAENENISYLVMDSEEFCAYAQNTVFSPDVCCITSPGLPYSNKAFKKIAELQIPIISEVELALRSCKNIPPLIAVTGTNGKTTVVELITHIINHSGKAAKAVGNIGTPLIEAFSSQDAFPDWFVVELSSFQLALTFSRRFSISCWLNISPNHLDWHSSMEEYKQAKEKLHSLTHPDGLFFMHESIKSTSIQGEKPCLIRYGVKKTDEISLLPKSLQHAAQHEQDNFLVAYKVAISLGISSQTVIEAFSTFLKPAHRLEFVRKMGLVTFIDDSKSSNVASTEAALYSCSPPVVLIAGGVHKGSPYTSWGDFSEKVCAIIAIGEAKEHIARDVGHKIPVLFAPSLSEAVKVASMMNSSGTVLLSPGCSSFDMFRDYKDRGRQFKEIVRSLSSDV